MDSQACALVASEAHGLSHCGFWALEHGLNSRGTQDWLLRGMWDQMEPVSPALAGRFFTTEPPGKPYSGKSLFKKHQREGSQAGRVQS